jgi:hypothetical protein
VPTSARRRGRPFVVSWRGGRKIAAFPNEPPLDAGGRAILAIVPIEIEDEVGWLRHRIVRMRTILRFAKDARIEAGLRELITDAEARLTALEAKRPSASA